MAVTCMTPGTSNFGSAAYCMNALQYNLNFCSNCKLVHSHGF